MFGTTPLLKRLAKQDSPASVSPIAGLLGGRLPLSNGLFGTMPQQGNLQRALALAGGNQEAAAPVQRDPGPATLGDGLPQLPEGVPGIGGGTFNRPGRIAQPGQTSPWGSVLSQPYDYEAARIAMLPPEKPHSKRHDTIMRILEIAGPALMAMGGNQAGANLAMQMNWQRRRDKEQRAFDAASNLALWKHRDYERQQEAALKAADPFTIGRNRLSFNPITGQTETLYEGTSDWEDYATSKGLKPGTPEYFKAVEDFVLRSAGPSATDNFARLDDHRTENDKSLEGLRADNRYSLERFRQQGASNLEDQRQQGRTTLEGQRQQGRVTLRGMSGAGGAAPKVPTATGPNGEKMKYVGGKWVPM